ncbi:unnamed protein product [Cochlearia groenlandica]
MNPNRVLTGEETPRNNELVPISCSISYPISKSTVAVGSKIYVLGGGAKNDVAPSTTVRVLDCHNHTWTDVPSMKVARKDAVAGLSMPLQVTPCFHRSPEPLTKEWLLLFTSVLAPLV